LRTILGAFLFSGDSVEKKVAVLSGGEKARLALARMLVRPAALLCLDEPTNHLDLASREVLEQALADFPGTIVFISHDRYFINRIATTVVEVVHGVLTRFPGSYDDYLDAKERGVVPFDQRVQLPEPKAAPAAPAPRAKAEPRPPARAAAPPATPSAPPPAPAVRLLKKRPSPEVKDLRKRIEELERQIHGLERRLEEIGSALSDPRLYLDGDRVRAVSGERKEVEERMAALMREWEELSTALSAHE
jgi:ATP-binding cassette subfamily F protein 3